VDANGDGQITQTEIEEHLNERFQILDLNGDGVLTKEEMKQGRPHKGKYSKGNK
jgi:hypothetical protein